MDYNFSIEEGNDCNTFCTSDGVLYLAEGFPAVTGQKRLRVSPEHGSFSNLQREEESLAAGRREHPLSERKSFISRMSNLFASGMFGGEGERDRHLAPCLFLLKTVWCSGRCAD